jgi:hypothetical protein
MLARVSRWLVASMLGLAPAVLGAQGMAVSPGTPVRVTLTGPDNVTLRGWIESVRADTLNLLGLVPTGSGASSDRRRSVQWQVLIGEVDSLEVRQGVYGHPVRGALYGTLAGMATGAAVGFASGSDANSSGHTKAVVCGTAFGALGAAVGGWIGSRIRYEKWVSVRPSLLRIEPAPQQPGVIVSLTISK